MIMEVVKIPAERVGALLGPNGETKKALEKKTKTRMKVSEDGEVEIAGSSAEEFFLKDVVKAIGRGFNPQDAEKLLNENYALEILDMKEFCKDEKDLRRIRGRIIGEEGKMKSEIEAATETKISVYGWTVGIIGPHDTVNYAKKAVYKIIDGAQLTTVFNEIARYKKEILANRLLGK